MQSITGVRDDRARWASLIDENLPPRALWPRLTAAHSVHHAETLNLAEELLSAAERSPRATAILTGTEQISYRALRDRMFCAAGALTRLGIQPGDRVAFRFHNTVDFVVVWLAVQWAGAIGVPIPPIYRRREIVHIVNHSGARLVVTSADLLADVDAAAAGFADPRVRVVTGLSVQDVPPPPFPAAADGPALITYISSAAGALKGVVHSPAEILATADTYAREVLELCPRDVCIGLPSMAWSFGLGALLVFPLRAGASTVLPEPGGAPLPNTIVAHRATVLFGVPTMYRLLLRQPDLGTFDLCSVRRSISAAEPLPAAVVDQWHERTRIELLDGIGTTELAHVFISSKSRAIRPGSIGQVVAGYDARVVDADGREVPDGVPGLLAVRGPTGARYWRDPEAQRGVVRNGWTFTGDVCSRDAHGWFTHLHRDDNLIVSGGYKVSPAEVERALLDRPDVCEARVFPVADATRGNVPHAEVRLAPSADSTGAAERLQQYLRQELAPYKCPRAIRLVK